MKDELDPKRLKAFAAILRHSKTKWIKNDALWSAFSKSFPTMSQSVERRSWFLAALLELEKLDVLQLPAATGQRWDRSIETPIPTAVFIDNVVAVKPRKWQSFPWHPRLKWVSSLKSVPADNEEFLLRVHEGLVKNALEEVVPLKYRSLQLTGNEKRLGELSKTQLFGENRLSFELLGCLSETPPLAFEVVGSKPSIIVFENADSFSVARNVLRNMSHPPYGLVGFGGGNGVAKSLAYLGRAKPAIEKIYYVGDLDYHGLEIAIAAARTAVNSDLPDVNPASEIHRAMLESASKFGRPNGWPDESKTKMSKDKIENVVQFLAPENREAVSGMLSHKKRIPEEVLGPKEFFAAWNSNDRKTPLGRGLHQC